ncbi:DUF6457 domain-containing protein [Plantactinospora sonchi]|uniref:DUF6457 domain-containing protein n=1 Tax=Plantactinospora sonchi TaxID=1544735 RepID=A0ABU7RPG6_9ACTN
MSRMDDWVTAACAELDLTPADVDVRVVLDLARDVAHHVLRPGAPVTAYLLGIAVGRGADPSTAAAALARLATGWPSADSDTATPTGTNPAAAAAGESDGTASDSGAIAPA